MYAWLGWSGVVNGLVARILSLSMLDPSKRDKMLSNEVKQLVLSI